MKGNKSNLILEKQIEKFIIQAYKEGEYARFYNLMNLLVKINPENKILLKYINKIDKKKKEKYLKKWAGGYSVIDFFKAPKVYISVFIWYILGYTK